MTQIQKWPKIKNDQKPIMSQIQKWPKIKSRSDATALRAEGAQADVRSALHSPDHPPFFVFLSFSCFYIYCGSMCFMGSMWAQQSFIAVLHIHLWWYYRDLSWLCVWKSRISYLEIGDEGRSSWMWERMTWHFFVDFPHISFWYSRSRFCLLQCKSLSQDSKRSFTLRLETHYDLKYEI